MGTLHAIFMQNNAAVNPLLPARFFISFNVYSPVLADKRKESKEKNRRNEKKINCILCFGLTKKMKEKLIIFSFISKSFQIEKKS